MKILVVGRGWVGKLLSTALSQRNHTVVNCAHTEVVQYVAFNYFDWVVNCAGVTGTPNVDACESNKKGTLEGNAVFPVKLQQLCARMEMRFAHFSSGCIYEGAITDVDAEPNYFGSIYSISKGISDSLLKNDAQVYRIRMPFTDEHIPKNYLYKVHKYATTGKLIDGGLNSLTDLNEAIEVVCNLLETYAPNGAYNLVNSGAVDMHELADMMGVTPQWYTDEEFAQVTVAKRSNCIIPPYVMMSPVRERLIDAITTLQKYW
jgi:dTDP-4-dehydrorhamnose reductase